MSENTNHPTGVGLQNWGNEFPDTHWSLFLTGDEREADSNELDQRFANLCSRYWYPLYAFLRKRGHASHDAQDLVQGFFTHLLSGRRMTHLDPSQGRFRSYLLGALNHYVSDVRRMQNAAKRGGGSVVFELDAAEDRFERALSDDLTPEKLFDREWAMNVLRDTTAALESEFREQGKSEVFSKLSEFIMATPPQGIYPTLAIELGISEPHLRTTVFRMRKRHASILREQVQATVSSATEIDDEIRYLLSVFS